MARFFKTPIHYQGGRRAYSVEGTTRTRAPNVNDNNYQTSSGETTYVFETYGSTFATNTPVNWIFIKGSGIASYSASVPAGKGSGAGVSGRVIPTTVTTPEGGSVETTFDGFQHDLLDLRSTPVRVVDSQPLTGATATVANDLASVSNAVFVSVQLTGATLTASATPGTVEVVGENPAGTTVRETLSFANTALGTAQATTQTYLTTTAVNLSGFSAGTVSITADSGVMNVTEVQLVFTGTNVRIYEIMLLEFLYEFDTERSFLSIDPTFQDNSLIQTNIRGETTRIQSLASRGKWTVGYRALFGDYAVRDYRGFMELLRNHRNFAFAQQFERYPERVFPATWGNTDFGQAYFTRRISSGTVVDFNIQES